MGQHLNEYSSALEQFEGEHVRPRAGRTLIVGSQVYGGKEDRRLRYAEVVGADMLPGPGVDLVVDLEETLPADIGVFDHVECMSVLEHSRRPWLLAANIERLMRPSATIFVSVPFVWRPHAYPHDYWRMTTEAIQSIFPGIDWSSLMYAHTSLREKSLIPSVRVDEFQYFARTESCGFGVKA